MKLRGKRPHERVAKTSISLPPSLYTHATNQVRDRGYSGLSGYLQELVRRDVESAAALRAVKAI